jgi:serralysin
MPLQDDNDVFAPSVDISLDPQAGGTFNNKPIYSLEQVAAHLNRTGAAYTTKPTDAVQQGDSDISTITFGFFNSQAELANNGYVYGVPQANGTTSFFGLNEYFNFAAFNAAQRDAAREAMTSWDDVVAVSFVETHVDNADITFGNLASAPTTQAYSRLPLDRITSNPAINDQIKWIAGDVWISASQPSNFQLDEGRYGMQTLTHEVGHSIGLSHPGAYNAAPGVSITYGPNAEYAQDTRAYSIMSYFEANVITGTRHFDFHLSTTAYSGVPLIHDIAAAQRIYGADMTTRTGDTVYGFNSNAGRDSFDFTKTPAPVMAIWDAGGNDTIDASGYATRQVIDLTPGSLSSIGGVTFETAPSLAQVNANRLAAGITSLVPQATYDANMNALRLNPDVGRLTDNVGIAYGAIIENAIGGSGADNLIGNNADNILRGNAGVDLIVAAAGNDLLDGGLGDDVMVGGTGDDRYMVDAAGDVVTEKAAEGTDTVLSAIDYSLGADVENLTLTGSAATGIGNGLDNAITGNELANLLDGGTGNDRLAGGAGDDRYIVDAAGDQVVELAGEGIDSVRSSVSYALTDNVENLVLTGAAQTGTGNGLNNIIIGNALANALLGGAGDDRLAGGDERDFLTGGAGSDTFVAELNSMKKSGKSGSFSTDTILDFVSGTDKIDLSGLKFASIELTGVGANKDAGDISFRVFDSVRGAETALGFDIDGIDGTSTYLGQVTMVYINNGGGAPDIALALIGTGGVTANDFIIKGPQDAALSVIGTSGISPNDFFLA